MDHDPDPLSFDARVNATEIAISILMDCDPISLLHVNGVLLVQAVRIFSQDIRMSFGLDKCAVLEMRRGRQVGSSGIDLPDDQHIREVEEEGYKYLVILQLDKTLNTR